MRRHSVSQRPSQGVDDGTTLGDRRGMTSGISLRSVLRRFHLLVGLTAGLVIAIIGVTGSLLVFYSELDAALNPEIRSDHIATSADLVRAEASLRRAYPDLTGPWRIEVTDRPGAIPARYYKPPATQERAFAPLMVWLSDDGRRIVRQDYWGNYAMTLVYDLHYRLLAEEAGARLVGYLGLVALVLLLSGLWIWWPRGAWAKALRMRVQGHRVRALRDWHKLLGLLAILPVGLLAFTGSMLALPQEAEAVLAPILGPVDVLPKPGPVRSHGAAGLSLVMDRARAALPGGRIAWIETPGLDGCCYRLRLELPDDPSRRFPHSIVWIDRTSGVVEAKVDVRDASPHTVLLNWIHPLHDGSVGGLATRVLAALAGLLPAVLFAIGVMRWRLRRQGRSRSQPA